MLSMNWKNIKMEMKRVYTECANLTIGENQFNDYIDFYNGLLEMVRHGFLSNEIYKKIYEYDDELFKTIMVD